MKPTDREARKKKPSILASMPPVKEGGNGNKVKKYWKDRPRLPDRSSFNVVYNAQGVTWTGRLAVQEEETELIFQGTTHSVFSLLSKLDDLYRKWKKGSLTLMPQCSGNIVTYTLPIREESSV